MAYNVKKEKFMNINEKTGLNIRKYREEQGYTQNDFAEECNHLL